MEKAEPCPQPREVLAMKGCPDAVLCCHLPQSQELGPESPEATCQCCQPLGWRC